MTEDGAGWRDNDESAPKLRRIRGLLRRPSARHLGAFLLFQAFWLAWMVPRLVGSHGDPILSSLATESSVFMWSMEWWAHAVGHAANPLLTSAVWAPTGMNLAWVTTLPGPALLLAPLTRVAGPIASFNTLSLLAPPLAAWTAYLLAHRVTRRIAPSLVGGFLFGFSPVLIREIQQGHLNLSMLFLLPLLPYLILRRVEGTIGRVSFVLLLSAVLVGQFSIFIETFATATVVGVLVGVVAWLLAPEGTRKRLFETGKLVAVSYVVVAVVVSPYLYTAFAYPDVAKPHGFSGIALGVVKLGDLQHFVRPGRAMALGPALGHDRPNVNFWYFGFPLLLILALFWVRERRDWKVRVLAVGFVLSVILALGPRLPVFGHAIPLPWTLFVHLPLLGRARPGRMVAYAFLIASLCAAMWVSQTKGPFRHVLIRWSLVFLAIVTILPKYWANIWTTNVQTPAFFSTGLYRQYLCPGETVLPVDPKNNRQVYWQVEARLYFRTANWYPGFVPVDYTGKHFVGRLTRGKLRPRDGPALRAFVADHGVTAVILGGAPAATARFASMLGVTPQFVGGVGFVRAAPCPSS